MEKAVETQSGIGDVVADEVMVDPVLLGVFILVLVRELDSEGKETSKSLMGGVFAVAYGILVACAPEVATLMGKDTKRLARRGEVLVSGKYRVGPIYEGLFD
ncbi:hypothetical protein FOF48_15095 [Corallococcus sp. Z5C101001]|nr:hypothetical protein FOF48_15095 [Corallococcus sp. Z5C101001]